MKKIYSLIVVAVLGTTTMFGQALSASLDYAMWNGTMTENSDTASAASAASTILSVNYTHELNDKTDLVGSLGYGMGFEVIAMKADLNYGITEKLSANLGMGLYMISDSIYTANAVGVVDLDDPDYDAAAVVEASTNEFGVNLGLGYQLSSALSLSFNYNMIKSGDFDFNGMQFGLAYSFGGKSAAKEETK